MEAPSKQILSTSFHKDFDVLESKKSVTKVGSHVKHDGKSNKYI